MYKTKILHIIPNLKKGGAERLVTDIVRELDARLELEIRLVIFHDEIEYDIRDIKYLIYLIPSSIKLSLSKKSSYKINGLQSFIDDFSPDIIHTHLFEAEIVSRSCYYPKAKWFSHCHDNMRQFANFSIRTFIDKQKLVEYYEKRYLLRQYKNNTGTNFIAISNYTKKYFQNTISKYPISLLHNAIDYNKFKKSENSQKQKKDLTITNTGSFVNKKNQAFILDIAQELKLKNIDFKIDLLGDGPNKSKLVVKSKQLGLENNLFFHGNVNNVEEFLWKSDIYLHTATYEPLGLVLLEAMAAGLPVITLDGKGNRDLIVEGKNGYMIFDQDPQLFADKIIEVWNDKPKYEEMSKYAQEYAKQYDINPYVEKLLALYQKAIDEKR
jgi:glycosyltransferase involved in cell wall biosynthesis